MDGCYMYRRRMSQLNKSSKYTLLQFQLYIAKVMCTMGTAPEKKRSGRPKLSASPAQAVPKRGPKSKRQEPLPETRYDDVAHWPQPTKMKNRCKCCLTGQTRMMCSKCDVPLCLTNEKPVSWSIMTLKND